MNTISPPSYLDKNYYFPPGKEPYTQLSKENILVSPYHCHKCFYIYETWDKYFSHLKLCHLRLTSELVKEYSHNTPCYIPNSYISPDRCCVILSSGERAGYLCLRSSPCKYHTFRSDLDPPKYEE